MLAFEKHAAVPYFISVVLKNLNLFAERSQIQTYDFIIIREPH